MRRPEARMSEIDRLRAIMDRLRGPDGCPWDREQTLHTLATFLVEETYEVLDAIATGTPDDHREELGDLLFQIVFQARLAQERGQFTLEDVMRSIGDKIVHRHPHVFGDTAVSTSNEVLAQWEQIKTAERRRKGVASMFAGVPPALPALLKALRVSSKAARVGFDWPDRDSLFAKLGEEVEELRQALATGDSTRIEDEIGDVLFTVANVARAAAIDPEAALQAATRKFMDRFRHVEERLREDGLHPAPEHRDRMETLWLEAKRRVRKNAFGRTSPSGGTSGSGARRAPRRARS
jgi:MazG family protein